MNEQFDKTLRDHVRDTFDHFDDQMVDDGWKKFNKKKNRRRRAIIFWYTLPTGIAAALALLWIINIYDVNNLDGNNQIAAKTEINKNNSVDTLTENFAQRSLSQNSIQSNGKQTERNRELLTSNNPERNTISLNKYPRKITKITLKKLIDPADENPTLAFNDLNQKEEELKIQNFNKILADDPKTITVTQFENSEVLESIPKTNKISVKEKGIAAASIGSKDPKAFLYNTFNKISDPILIGKKKRFNLSIDATTYMNFSENGIYDQVNLGLGITSDYQLGKRISVNSGLSFNRQTSSFGGNNRTASDFQATSFNNIASIPKAQITNAKLVGVDIPLNLKYWLKVGKSDAFITTGFSSYALINERYVNDFSVINYGVNGVRTSNVRTIQDNPEGAFAYFKFAQTVNLSFGVKYPLTKKSSVSVEPFIKYPLSGMGYQNLRIGSGGISFKLNLSK